MCNDVAVNMIDIGFIHIQLNKHVYCFYLQCNTHQMYRVLTF